MGGFSTGTVITAPPAPLGTDLNRTLEPLPYTKMPLLEWAKRMGINPIHFLGGRADAIYDNRIMCSELWYHLPWQGDGNSVTHYDLALALQAAEQSIEEELKYNIAPDFLVEEHSYPRYYSSRRTNMVDSAGRRPAVQLKRGKLLSIGTRKLTALAASTVAMHDRDDDDFAETAYITVTYAGDPKDLAVYPRAVGTHPSWELRYPKGWFRGSGHSLTLIYDWWYLFKPELFYRMPYRNSEPFDALDPDNLQTMVDVYVKSVDTTAPVRMDYEGFPGLNCSPLDEPRTLSGSALVRDSGAGLINVWHGDTCLPSPDRLRVAYYSGATSREYDNEYVLDPMPAVLAQAAFYLSAARLNREICGCNNVVGIAKELREDMALVSPQGNFLAVADAIQENPFGTKKGEWLAFKAIQRLEKYWTVGIV